MIERILPTARLPFQQIRGRVSERNKMAHECSSKLFEKMGVYKDYSIKKLRKDLQEILGKKDINIKIEKEINDDCCGTTSSIYTISGDLDKFEYRGFRIRLPLNKKGNKIINTSTAIHETRHLFDRLFQPKYLLLRVNSTKIGNEYDEDVSKLFEILFEDLDSPIKTKEMKKNIIQYADNIPAEAAVEILQKIRYRLMSEINAYNEEINFAFKKGLSFKNLVNIIADKITLDRDYRFNTKLKLVEKLLREKLALAREEIRQNLKTDKILSK